MARPGPGAILAGLVAAVLVVAAVAALRPAADDDDDPAARSAAQVDRAAARPAGEAERALARAAQRLVGVRPSDLGYRLVLRGPRAGVRAATDPAARTITLYLGPGQVAHRVAHDLAHEIGHAYDARRMTAAQRRAWLARRGAVGRPWLPDGERSDYATGAGDFAEVFARCHAASPEFRSRLAPAPADACALLPPSAARLGDPTKF